MCLQEDLSDHVQGDAQPGYVGTACLLSSSFLESGKDNGIATLPIMGRNSRQTIGKVRGKILYKKIPRWLTVVQIILKVFLCSSVYTMLPSF